MITISNMMIKEIPALHVVKQELEQKVNPIILFIHGFGSAKDRNLQYAYHLAERGFRVILPDAMLHGDRKGNAREEDIMVSFLDIVLQTVQELQLIKDELVRSGLADEKRIGVAGTSMGGIITLAAMTQYPWINTAAALMGNPALVSYAKQKIKDAKKQMELPQNDEEIEQILSRLASFDLSLQTSKLEKRPLLFWHGKKDNVVPYEDAYQFYNSVKTTYEDEKKIRFVLDEHASHKVSRVGMFELVNWFSIHLQ